MATRFHPHKEEQFGAVGIPPSNGRSYGLHGLLVSVEAQEPAVGRNIHAPSRLALKVFVAAVELVRKDLTAGFV